jgi:DNA-binding IclR family transcriptional regulator
MSQGTRRTLAVLEYLAAHGGVSLSRLASDLGLTTSTAHRCLSALAEQGYVVQDGATKQYALSMKLVAVVARALDNLDIRAVVKPVLRDLATRVGETAHLAVRDGDAVTYIDKVAGTGAIQMASHVGYRAPCHATALGKVLLAHETADDIDGYLERSGLPALTPNTITDPESFEMELERVRRRGYAIDNAENETGIRCVAAPVRDHRGAVVAALSVSGWTLSMTRARIRTEVVPAVVEHATEASRRMGAVR